MHNETLDDKISQSDLLFEKFIDKTLSISLHCSKLPQV